MSSAAYRPRRENASTGRSYFDAGIAFLRNEAAQLKLVDYVLFAVMAAFSQDIAGIPLNQVMVFVIVVVGFSRVPAQQLGPWRWLVVLMAIMLLYVGVVSFFGEPGVTLQDPLDWRRRLVRLVGVTFLIWFLASGRIHIRSALLGYVTVLVVNVPLFYAGLVSNTYGGYLTGLFGDKNQAGLIYCVIGILVMYIYRTRIMRVLALVFFSAALWLTGSRTSLAAFAFAVVWMLLAPRLGPFFRIALGVLTYFSIQYVTAHFAENEAFGDRTGTDALRGRIDDAAWAKTQEAGFFGMGLGNARVQLPFDYSDHLWFFHNSYWSALVEGGWPWMIFLVGVTVFALVNPFGRASRLKGDFVFAQGLGIALLICASRLGEVFYTVPWALSVGFALHAYLVVAQPAIRANRYLLPEHAETGAPAPWHRG